MKTANVNIALSFEQIISIVSQLPSVDKIKLKHYLSKEIDADVDILKDIKQGLNEVKQHEKGEIELKSLDQVLDEL